MPAASWVIVLWLSVLGAVLGSFFNVVVYRLPRGGSLVEPPSHCPKCKHPIRWRDNVPMLSWLLLRGRCRDCGIPISARYPLVEAACFLSFLILAVLECGMQGINLPAQRQPVENGLILTLGWSGRELYGLFLYHELLWCTLLIAALIEYDGHRVSWRVHVPALAIGTMAGMAAPVLHPVSVWAGVEGWHVGPLNVAAGLAAGGLLGWLLTRWEPEPRRNGVGLGLACAGLILGWQAAVGLAVATLLWQAAVAVVGRPVPKVRNVPTSMALAGFTFLWLVTWAMLAPWLPGV